MMILFLISKKGRAKSIISDYSKIPPIIYESAGIDRSDNYRDSDDTFYLKRKVEYYENIEDVSMLTTLICSSIIT